jgi:hypothetical protein
LLAFYITMLDEIVAYWAPSPHLDNSPLLALLDAIEVCDHESVHR